MWDGSALGFTTHGWNFVDNTKIRTMLIAMVPCAGTIGAVGNNAKGVAGVAWSVKIMAVKVLNDLGYGATSWAIDRYNWVLARKNRGVNTSP